MNIAVQRQLEAYNARDLDAFLAQYSDDVRVFRPPAPEHLLVGKPALAAYYAQNVFVHPNLRANVIARMTSRNIVVDHEQVVGLQADMFETIAVYRILDGLITAIWFF